MSSPVRRTLAFATLGDVVADVRNLEVKGYEKAGNWDLAQVCFHLSEWMRFPMDGFPRPPLIIGAMFWVVRNTIGKRIVRKVLSEGFPVGSRTMPQTVILPGSNLEKSVAELNATVERFRTRSQPIFPSPFFGAMDKIEATKLQLAHCAHHLSFLIPKA